MLSGEQEAHFDITKRVMRLERKNSADPANQLEQLIEFLEERYQLLNIVNYRQTFMWRNITQYNLIAVLPKNKQCGSDGRPIILADHIDTAFCEDIFEQSGKRVSTTGADDNVSAVATLLAAAKLLQNGTRCRDIWLVHLTGEEYPGDDLGARHFVNSLFEQQIDVYGIIQLDMIGWRANPNDPIFQVNAGLSNHSQYLAHTMLQVAKRMSFPIELQGTYRGKFDARSYLFNTDAVIYDALGFDTILLNEHINELENIERKGYHDTMDTTRLIDWNYVTSVAQIAIATVNEFAVQP